MFPTDLWRTMSEIAPLRRYFVSPDYDRALDLLTRHLDWRRLEFTNAAPVNRWRIHPGWVVREAGIYRDGSCIYDAMGHPNQVIALSTSFVGRVSREELRAHQHSDQRDAESIPFHFRQMYRPWERTWGFCAPQASLDALAPGEYDVRLRTEEYDGALKVIDHTLPGRRRETIVLGAHLDHPGMANDDLAGVMVGVRLMQLLRERARLFTYRLVVGPEIIGSEYYLAHCRETGESADFLLGLFLEMLGTRTPLCLQKSFDGGTALDLALEAALAEAGAAFRVVPFRGAVGNDEVNWEAHGIAMPQLTRYPYPEYHTDRDDMTIIAPEALEEAAQVALAALDKLEQYLWLRKTFSGTPCVSHPELDLYVDPGQPVFAHKPPEQGQMLRQLMDWAPIVFRQWQTAEVVARRLGLPAEAAREYLGRWVEKGLLEAMEREE